MQPALLYELALCKGPTREAQPSNNVAAPSGVRKGQLSRARQTRAASLGTEQRKTKGFEIGSGGDGDKGSVGEGIIPSVELQKVRG